METPGLKDRIGSVGNQFALSTLLGTLALFPVFLLFEASKFGKFIEIFKTSAELRNDLITSGLYFYLYNELSTLVVKKTSATTQSVANTAKVRTFLAPPCTTASRQHRHACCAFSASSSEPLHPFHSSHASHTFHASCA